MLNLKKIGLIILISTLVCNSIIAQEKKKWIDFAISPGIIFQKQTFGELNFLIGEYKNAHGGNTFQGIRIGVESNLKGGYDHIFAPKVGIELSAMIFCTRASILTYFYNYGMQFRFIPELGISYFSFANLTYGYSFSFSKNEINGIIKHRVCLSINLNRNFISGAF
jgi:hypothetical protein